MAYTSFDPRKAFRENLGTLRNIEESELQYCITVTDDDNEPLYIPIYLSEEIKSEQLPVLPYIEMRTVETLYEPHDIGAATRKMESYIDMHIYFTDTDNIDRTSLAKKIKDKVHDLVRINQSITTGITFMNVENDRLEEETDGRQVVYHYIATLYCLYYDLC